MTPRARPNSFSIAIAVAAASVLIGGCFDDNDAAVQDPTTSSDVGIVGQLDGKTTTPDSGGSLNECVTDSKCVAKFPDTPACQKPTCVQGSCKLLSSADQSPCEDGDLCTIGDYCLAGTCRVDELKDCKDGNPCTADKCDSSNGACVYEPVPAKCEKDGSCAVGVCVGTACEAKPKLFEADVTLPGFATTTGIAQLKSGNLVFAGTVNVASEVTRVTITTVDPAGKNAKSTELLPLVAAHDVAADGDAVLLAGEATISGSNHQGTVLRWADNKVSWLGHYGGKKHDALYAVIPLANGGFAASGATASKGSGQHDAWFIRGNKTGFALMNYSFGSKDDEHAYAIAPAAAGGFIIAGEQRGPHSSDGLVFRITDTAALLWIKHIGGAFNDRVVAVARRDDGGYLAVATVGTSSIGGTATWLRVYDGSGNVSWTRKHSGPGDLTAVDARIIAADGSLLVVGAARAKGAGAWQPIAWRANGLGVHIWSRQWPSIGTGRLQSIAPLSDGFVGLADHLTATDDKATVVRADAFGATTCAASGPCAKRTDGCDDGNGCTADTCTAKTGCAHKPLPDKTPCFGAKTCSKGACGG